MVANRIKYRGGGHLFRKTSVMKTKAKLDSR